MRGQAFGASGRRAITSTTIIPVPLPCGADQTSSPPVPCGRGRGLDVCARSHAHAGVAEGTPAVAASYRRTRGPLALGPQSSECGCECEGPRGASGMCHDKAVAYAGVCGFPRVLHKLRLVKLYARAAIMRAYKQVRLIWSSLNFMCRRVCRYICRIAVGCHGEAAAPSPVQCCSKKGRAR